MNAESSSCLPAISLHLFMIYDALAVVITLVSKRQYNNNDFRIIYSEQGELNWIELN